jgi:hypothetical protein
MPHEFMKEPEMSIQTKIVGTSGQISIGKQYAGQQVIVEEIEPGEWRIQTAITIPKSQAWVHTQHAQVALGEALDWAAANAPKKSSLAALSKKLNETASTKTAATKAKAKNGRG